MDPRVESTGSDPILSFSAGKGIITGRGFGRRGTLCGRMKKFLLGSTVPADTFAKPGTTNFCGKIN